MITNDLSTLQIHKLSEEQFKREVELGRMDPTAIYMTPDIELFRAAEGTDSVVSIVSWAGDVTARIPTAKGWNCFAFGPYAKAGYYEDTSASSSMKGLSLLGNYGIALGYNTAAVNRGFAANGATAAIGGWASAFGQGTKAIGLQSIATGNSCYSFGDNSLTLGYQTKTGTEKYEKDENDKFVLTEKIDSEGNVTRELVIAD
jgi:hypothetical protein